MLLVIGACAPATPATRIERNPEIFRGLTGDQQDAVRDGRILRGMSKEAVLLAWGRPAQQFEQVRAEGPVVRWDYTGTRAVHTQGFHGQFGRGFYGPHGPYWRNSFYYGPDIAYIPYRRASVWFVNGRVDEWESMR